MIHPSLDNIGAIRPNKAPKARNRPRRRNSTARKVDRVDPNPFVAQARAHDPVLVQANDPVFVFRVCADKAFESPFRSAEFQARGHMNDFHRRAASRESTILPW